MYRLVMVIALTGAIFGGAQALAVDSANRSTMSKRQLIAQTFDCMKKRMSVNRNISYNEALKACKDEINKGSDNSPSGTLVASDTPAQ